MKESLLPTLFFFFNDTATTEIYTLSYTTLFRSDRTTVHECLSAMCCVSQKKPPRPLAAQGPRPPRGGRFLPWGDPAAKKTHVRTCIHTVSGGIDSKNAAKQARTDRKSVV